MFVVSLRCSNWYEGSDVLKAVALQNAFYFNCSHPDVFLLIYLKYISVKTQLYSVNYTCSNMFRLKVIIRLFAEPYLWYIK